MATTENVTVLFTDLVGSTELASLLTPDAGDEVRRKHFSALRQVIATTGGTEVKNLGDGLMVVFPAASAALGCAVAMQQAVHRDNADAERPLGLRVGLSAGESTREGADYFGDPVIEAARLCARAEGGQILVSDLVRATAGRRSPHPFKSIGELELKGLPEPIDTLEVGWEPLAVDTSIAEEVPLPARLSHRPDVGVIGREAELATLETAAKAVASGEGRQLILISGEPGLGKTTLVSELARRVHEAGTTVLLGRCDEEVGVPYRPFAESLFHYVSHAPEEVLRSHVSDHGGELARMVPALQKRLGELPPPQSTDPDTERYLLYAAVVGLLESASDASAIVLVLDDLHWADKPSLQLLRHLVANTSNARLLVIGTYRDAELSASHPLTEALAALHREPAGVSSIELKGLDDTGVISFMESAAGHELDDAGVGLAHQVYRETDGNPFFVAEMLRNLAESGAIFQDDTGRWAAADAEGSLALPHSVRTVIGTRVSRLGEGATKVLSTASVIGRDFDLDILAAATQVDEDELIGLLEEAHRAALVNELPDSPGRYGFSHALIQHTLYEDLGATRRTRIHRTLGEAMERLYGSADDHRVAELARHFLLATRPADAEKAVTYARRAGERAMGLLAPDEARRWYTQALATLEADPSADDLERTHILLGLGEALWRSGSLVQAKAIFAQAAACARDLNDAELFTRAALGRGTGLGGAGFADLLDETLIELLTEALHFLGEEDSALRVQAISRLAIELYFSDEAERRRGLAKEAVAMARRLGDTSALLVAIYSQQWADLGPDGVTERIAAGTELVSLAERTDDREMAYRGHHILLRGHLELGDTIAADAEIDACDRIAAELRQPFYIWQTTAFRALQTLMRGDLPEGERLANEALQIGLDSDIAPAFSFFIPQWGHYAFITGAHESLVDPIQNTISMYPAKAGMIFRSAQAFITAELGRTSQAVEQLEVLSADEFAGIGRDWNWLATMCLCGWAAASLERGEYAEAIYEKLRPYEDRLALGSSGVIGWGAVASVLGAMATLLGRWDVAEGHFARARDLLTKAGWKGWESMSAIEECRWRVLRNRPGDHETAIMVIDRMKDDLVRLGFGNLVDRVERLRARAAVGVGHESSGSTMD